MQLSDFFSQLNPLNLSLFFLAFIIFDAVGINIAYFIKPSAYLRSIYWVWGLGIVTFFWFLLHLFLPFWPQYIWISLIFLGLCSFPIYWKQKGLQSLIFTFTRFPFPLIILIIALKPLYFLLSAPPYYADEMIYHFYSPARLYLEKNWIFVSSILDRGAPNLYEMIPKFLNESYWLMLSLTKTYATARLLHFMLVFSAIYAISLYLRKNLNLSAGILYAFFSLYLSAAFLNSSTLGYVDAGVSAFAILFLVTIADLISHKTRSNLYASAAVLGITVGIKYTILAFLFSVIIISIIFTSIIYYKDINKLSIKILNKYKKEIIPVSLLTLFIAAIFGGYWYIKNLLMSGNPVYPFFFNCLHGWKCATGFNYFSGWAIPLDLKHFSQIRSIIFQNSNVYYYITLIALAASFVISKMTKIKSVFYLSGLIICSLLLEIFLSHNTSGFELRYYYHWVLLIPLVLILPLGVIFKFKGNKGNLKSLTLISYLLLITLTVGPIAIKNIKRMYEGDFVWGYVRNYAMRRIDLNQWLDYYYPAMNDFVKWCGEKRPMKDVLVIDPSLVWLSNEEYMKVFMVNCNLITNVTSDYNNSQKLISSLKNNHPYAYIVSLEKCDRNKSYENINPDKSIVSRFEANREVICRSKEIFKNVYRLGE